MANIVIFVKGAQAVELPSVKPEAKGGKIVAPGFHPQKLIPGENDVDSSYWDKVKGNKAVKMYLACDLLTNRGEGKAKTLVKSLDSLHPDTALRHIGKCESVQALNDWKDGSNNPALQKAIADRIAEIVASQTGEASGADAG